MTEKNTNYKKGIFKKAQEFAESQTALGLIFAVCFAYWAYLVFFTKMGILFDAVEYERLGTMLYRQGWVEFFKTGPHREPLYPFLISLSMHIGSYLSVSYQYIQKIIQILSVFSAQILMIVLMRKLKISRMVQLLTVLYFGFSPAVMNSAMSLFSEVSSYPFVVWAVLSGVVSWEAMNDKAGGRVFAAALSTAAAFTMATFSKGVFQYIFLIFLLPFALKMLWAFKSGHRQMFSRLLRYVIITVFIFEGCLASYKFLNKKYNGRFEFSDRYADLLYGNAHKRANPLTMKIFLAHIASIPGGGVCRRFYSEEECRYCEFFTADFYRSAALEEILKGIPKDMRNDRTLQAAFEKIRRQPLQYAVFMGIEGMRMPFWESTQIGFVEYPPGLQRLYSSPWLKDGLRLFVSLVTLWSLGFLLICLWKGWKRWRSFEEESERFTVCFFIFLTIFMYTTLYSLFSVVTRYALPLAPLYLLTVAYGIDNMVFRKKAVR